MAREKKIKNDGLYGTDPFAAEAACTEIQWFWPSDFDMADNDPDARNCTGWFYRDGAENGNDRWIGPFATSTDAGVALAKVIT